MRIAINALSARAGGTVSALINLLPEIARIDKNNKYLIFIAKTQEEILETIPLDFIIVKIGFVTGNPYIRIIWEQLFFPIYLIYYGIDVLYSLGNITTLLAPCKVVLLMENSNPYSIALIKWPWRERLRNKLIKLLGLFSAKRADKVRFVSESSKNLLLKHLKIPKKKCVTIYHGCILKTDDKGYNSIEEDMHDYNYILTVSIISPHKNLIMLIKAFNILVRQYNYNGRLLLVGDQCYPDYLEKLRSLIFELNLENKVIFLGKVQHKYIGYYYNRGGCFCFYIYCGDIWHACDRGNEI